MSAEVLAVRGLTVEYEGAPALSEVSVTVAPGEVLAVLGPSGSGKSTLLNAVAGFRTPNAGEVWLQGRLVASPGRAEPPERRNVGVVFQSYALWPHLSVLDTVAYPERRRGVRRREAQRDAAALLELLHIGDLAHRRPAELSGGEQQRVGLARALARRAALYLFDEPTAHLDTHVRGVFLEELVSRQRATGAAALYATHDAEEALALADRVALLHAGRLIQLGPPAQVYAEPVDALAARLTGPASVLRAPTSASGDNTCTLTVAATSVTASCAKPPGAGVHALLVRPDWARMGGPLTGRLRAVLFRGPHCDHLLETAVGDVLVREPGTPRGQVGDQLSWTLDRVWALGQASASAAPE